MISSGTEELSLGARRRGGLRSGGRAGGVQPKEKQEEEEDEEEEEEEEAGDPTVTAASVRRSSRRRLDSSLGGEEADTESGQDREEEEEDLHTPQSPLRRTSRRSAKAKAEAEHSSAEEEETEETPVGKRKSRRIAGVVSSEEEREEEELEEGELEDLQEEEEEETETEGRRRSSRRTRLPVERLQVGVSEEEEESSSGEEEEEPPKRKQVKKKSPLKKRKYGLREKVHTIRRYQDEFPAREDRSSREQGLIRRGANTSRRSKAGGGERRERRRQRTGDSSSPSDSLSSDQEAFDKRKTKRMMLEREKMRPLNMNKNDVNKSIFKDRSKSGSSLADVQPMEMDMGVTFESVGGLKEHVNALKEMVMFPLLYPELFQQFSIQPPRGVLFFGPPGTGKTLLARALACECSTEQRKVAFFMRKGADCLSKWIGESERQLRLLFDQAYQMRPSIIFFDEIDGLAPVRSSRQDQIHSSIVSTLLALMDGLDNRGEIVLIGATNRIENIDPALRRPGRFDRELRFALPDKRTRQEILKLHTTAWQPPIAAALLNTLGTRTIGYCGADLKGLTAEAALNALRRSYPQVYQSSQKLAIDLTRVQVTKPDFEKALRKIVPSTHRVEDKLLGPLPKQVSN